MYQRIKEGNVLFEKQKNWNLNLSDTYCYVFITYLHFRNLVGLNTTICGRNMLPSQYDKLIIELWRQWKIPFIVVGGSGSNYCHLKTDRSERCCSWLRSLPGHWLPWRIFCVVFLRDPRKFFVRPWIRLRLFPSSYFLDYCSP